LGGWVIKQRTKKSLVSIDRRQKLESLNGWSWNPHSDSWDEGYTKLRHYVEEHQTAALPRSYESKDKFKLGGWVKKQRANKNTMSSDRRQKLDSVPGWRWDITPDLWEQGFVKLKSYSEVAGDCLPPPKYRNADGYRLGQWVVSQRYAKQSLDAVSRQRLESLVGWSWDPFDDAWENGYAVLTDYCDKSGTSDVSKAYKTESGYTLGVWVTNQRVKKAALTDERRLRLESLKGWTWDSRNEAWERSFAYLVDYTKREGNSCVPTAFKEIDGYPLGQWVGAQRTKRQTMPVERKRRLEQLEGWSWDGREARWSEGYGFLVRYAKTKGNCAVPQGYKTPEGYALGYWVSNQRQAKRNMPTSRRRRLENIAGWKWGSASSKP